MVLRVFFIRVVLDLGLRVAWDSGSRERPSRPVSLLALEYDGMTIGDEGSEGKDVHETLG